MANLQLTVNLGYLFCKTLDGSAFSCRSIGTFGITMFFGPSRITQAQCDIWSEKKNMKLLLQNRDKYLHTNNNNMVNRIKFWIGLNKVYSL